MKEIEVFAGQHINSIFSLACDHFNTSKEPITFQHNALRIVIFRDES